MWTLISFAFFLISCLAAWRMYEKAGQRGWIAFIPILNLLGVLKMIGKPFWFALLYLIPFVNVLVHVIVSVQLARSFGRSALFGLVMAIPAFTPFCIAYLGLGDVRYLGPEQ
ncbi:MAG: DUF5684 domain-containing protein [Minicystis sp.]